MSILNKFLFYNYFTNYKINLKRNVLLYFIILYYNFL